MDCSTDFTIIHLSGYYGEVILRQKEKLARGVIPTELFPIHFTNTTERKQRRIIYGLPVYQTRTAKKKEGV
ncbi:MAG: hypothetical protein HW390_466 [Candidatus Brocadiaceae bacterium]|nr:hypothetical protein [Candidatus Brocadiaceae bacterium]